MSRVMLVTNDFPPRHGGIQSFVHGMASRLDVDNLVVYCSTSPGAARFDAAQPFEVVREDTTMLLPTAAVARRATHIAKSHQTDAVWFGAAAPLGLLAKGLKRRSDIRRAVALTHGHEAGWGTLPISRQALRHIAKHNDIMTYLAQYFHERLFKTVGSLTQLERLTFGVDTERFSPDVDGEPVRERYGLANRPLIMCVSRLVPRKGQDLLIDALAKVRRAVPDAALLLVGAGPYESALRRRAARAGQADNVVLTGAIADDELPEHHAAADVFAMPCRTRRAGFDVEGLGVVCLEAAASAKPVVVGDSGGAPDTVRDGETGYVVDGTNASALANRLIELLNNEALAKRMGRAGRAWMCSEWTWNSVAHQMARYLGAPLHPLELR